MDKAIKESVQAAVYCQSNQVSKSTEQEYTTGGTAQQVIRVYGSGTVTVGGNAHTVTGMGLVDLGVLADFTTFTLTPASGTMYAWTLGTAAATLSEAE